MTPEEIREERQKLEHRRDTYYRRADIAVKKLAALRRDCPHENVGTTSSDLGGVEKFCKDCGSTW